MPGPNYITHVITPVPVRNATQKESGWAGYRQATTPCRRHPIGSLCEEASRRLVLLPLLDTVRVMARRVEDALLTVLAPRAALDADGLPVAEGIRGVLVARPVALVALAHEVVVVALEAAVAARRAEPAVLHVVQGPQVVGEALVEVEADAPPLHRGRVGRVCAVRVQHVLVGEVDVPARGGAE